MVQVGWTSSGPVSVSPSNPLQRAIENRNRGGGSSSRNRGVSQNAKAQEEAKAKAEAEAKLKAQEEAKAEIVRQEQIKQENLRIALAKKNQAVSLPETGIMPSYEKRVGDVPIKTVTPRFGSTTYNPVTGKAEGGFIIETATPIEREYKFQVERGVPFSVAGRSKEMQTAVISSNVASDISKKYQAKVDSGELTFEKAQAQASEEYLVKSNKELEKISTSNRNGGIYKTKAEAREELAIGTGKAIVSSNPLGASILGARALQKNERVIIDKKGNVPLYPELRQTSPEAALYFGAGAVSSLGLPFQAARQYDKATTKALNIKPLKFLGEERVYTDKSVVKLVGRKGVRGATQEVVADIPGYALKGNRFSIQGGTAKITTETKPLLRTLQGYKQPIVSVEQVKLFGRGEIRQGLSRLNNIEGVDIFKPIKQKVTRGEYGFIRGGSRIKKIDIYKVPQQDKQFITLKGEILPEKVSRGKFASLSEEKGGLTFIKGGKAKSLKIYPGKRATFKYGLGQEGVLKRVDVPEITGFTTGTRGTKGLPKIPGLSTEQAKSQQVTKLGEALSGFGQATSTELKIKPPASMSIRSPAPILSTQQKSSPTTSTIQLQVPKITASTYSTVAPRTISRTITRTSTRQKPTSILEAAQLPKIESKTKQTNLQGTRQQLKQQQALKGVGLISPNVRTPSFVSRPFFFTGIPVGFKIPSSQTVKQPKGLFNVEVRRGGKFRSVGTTTDLNKALSLGRTNVGKTLAATYRVKGINTTVPGLRVQKNFYAKTDKKEGLLFIEKRGKRLKRGSGEIEEILGYKRRKGGKK